MDNLIAKLEGAAEGSRELDFAIWRLVDPANASFCLDNGKVPLPWLHCYTTSLDAAMTLVPEGYAFGCGHGTNDAEVEGWAWCGPDEGPFVFTSTPALALCIAALKARAQQEMKS